MTNGLKLAPDLCINARETTAEQAVKEIVKLRPEGYDGWDGVDGWLQHHLFGPLADVGCSRHPHCRSRRIPRIRYRYHQTAGHDSGRRSGREDRLQIPGFRLSGSHGDRISARIGARSERDDRALPRARDQERGEGMED